MILHQILTILKQTGKGVPQTAHLGTMGMAQPINALNAGFAMTVIQMALLAQSVG